MHLKLPDVTFKCMYITSMSIFNHVFALPFIFPSYFTTVNYEKIYFILGNNIQKAEASNMID